MIHPQRVWFCSTKGRDGDVKFTFMNQNGNLRHFDAAHQYRGMEQFINQFADIIVSMEYSIVRLHVLLPNLKTNKEIKIFNLKDMFRECLIMFRGDEINRSIMMKFLGMDIKRTEPNYPAAYGDQTCRTYQAIYNTIQELIDF